MKRTNVFSFWIVERVHSSEVWVYRSFWIFGAVTLMYGVVHVKGWFPPSIAFIDFALGSHSR